MEGAGSRPGRKIRLQALEHAAARERRISEHNAGSDHGVAGNERAAPPRVGFEREFEPRATPRVGCAELPAEAGAQRGAREQVECRARCTVAQQVVALQGRVPERVVAAASAADECERAGSPIFALARDLEVDRA